MNSSDTLYLVYVAMAALAASVGLGVMLLYFLRLITRRTERSYRVRFHSPWTESDDDDVRWQARKPRSKRRLNSSVAQKGDIAIGHIASSQPSGPTVVTPPELGGEGGAEGTEPPSAWGLLREYYVQGLSQSKVSFATSLVAATLGFVLIVGSAVMALLPMTSVNSAVVGLIAGAITEAVAALFFVQTNRSRALMQSMHGRLRKDNRVDRQYHKSLELIEQIRDPDIQDELRAEFARHFVRITPAVRESGSGESAVKRPKNPKLAVVPPREGTGEH